MSLGIEINLDAEECPVRGETVTTDSRGVRCVVVFDAGQPAPCYLCHAVVPADETGGLPPHRSARGLVTDEFLRAIGEVRRRVNTRPMA
ncbi:MAG: hypothetical protein ACYDCP_07085 [Thermoplasmataceae archaeon]